MALPPAHCSPAHGPPPALPGGACVAGGARVPDVGRGAQGARQAGQGPPDGLLHAALGGHLRGAAVQKRAPR
eukprot:859769-Prymnesium_polylepis.1